MRKVFFSARIISHDIGHNKFTFGNNSVSNGKKLYPLKFNQKISNRFNFLITAVFFFFCRHFSLC